MAERTHLDFLEDIVIESEKVAEFIKGFTYADFAQDGKTVYAVIRALEIVGEATKYIPQAIRDKYPAVPWRVMAGLRDRLIHAYFGVKLDVVWLTASDSLPKLTPLLRQILAAEKLSQDNLQQ